MNRKNLLTSTMARTAGVGLVASDTRAVRADRTKSPDAKNKVLSTPFLETRDRAMLFCKDWGAGKPTVFVHSWGTNSELWQYQMLHLSGQGLRGCIAYDQRGHGRSSQPGYGYDYDTLADDLASLLEQLDLCEVTLVGHSMGCGEIVRYLSRRLQPCHHAVFIGTANTFSLKDLEPEESGRMDKGVNEWVQERRGLRISEVAWR